MKKLLGFLAVMITALFVLGACGQSTKSTPSTEVKTITLKVGLSDGSETALLEPVEISVPKGKKLFELFADPKVGGEIQKKLTLNESFEYSKGADTYTVDLSTVFEDVKATMEIPADTVVEAGATGYLKATKK